MLFAVVMAGGSGTRFWPASREVKPKQLLDLTGDRTMIQATLDRLEGLVPADRMLVVTNRMLVEAIGQQLPEVPTGSILGEPCRRDTAPCVGLAAALTLARDPDATLVVMPSDHVIRPVEAFRGALQHAVDLVDSAEERIVTFGICPTYPAEIYGYIERRQGEAAVAASPATYRVASFHEKPPAARAAEYLATGRFYWNSGIFVWKARTIWNALERFEPAMFAHLKRIADSIDTTHFGETLEREFTALQGRSIDHAVMERFAGEILVVEAPFDWDDVGNWPSLARLLGSDEHGNTIQGRHLGIETSGTIVRSSDDHLVVTVGLEDCIVVHTRDATLVARRSHEERIRKVVSELRERGWTEYL